MISQGKKFKIILALLFVLFLNILIFNDSSQSDENHINGKKIESYELIPSSPELNITSPANISYYDNIPGYYPASDGFDNDVIGGDLDGWIDESGASCDAYVVDEKENHKYVLKLKDEIWGNKASIRRDFSQNQSSGTIEMWVLKGSEGLANTGYEIYIRNSLDHNIMYIEIDRNGYGRFRCRNGSDYLEFGIGMYTIDTWFHIRIDFNCTLDTYDIYLNNNLEKSNLNFYSPTSSISYITFNTESNYEGELFLDALGLSWDPNYNVGDNLKKGILLSYESSFIVNTSKYSLNGQINKTIKNNTVLAISSDGLYTVKVYANDSTDNWYESDIVYFTANIFNDNKPELYGSVLPINGNQGSQYNFSVKYYDFDNNPSAFVNISINGTIVKMEKQNASDNNYMDGCVYEYLTYLQPGSYNYSYNCSDGTFNNWTINEVFQVSKDNTIAPVLSDGMVNPTWGYNNSALYNLSVNYTDPDNMAPSYVNVMINSTAYSMIKADETDSIYIDGCIYNFNMTLSTIGTYEYYFNCSDGDYTDSDGPYTNLIVDEGVDWDQKPLDGLRIGSVVTHGETNPRTLYSKIVSDLQGRGATITDITSTIDLNLISTGYDMLWLDQGGSAMNAIEVNAIEQWVKDGGEFIITGDYIGSSDDLLNKFNITKISGPGEVITKDIYFHPITYKINELTFPYPEKSLNISSQPDAKLCVEGLGDDLIITMEYGKGKFVVICSNGLLIQNFHPYNLQMIHNSFGWLGYEQNDNVPKLINGDVNPTKGIQSTFFTFSVNYSDIDNNSPKSMNLVINDTSYSMVKQDPTDMNYTDGCVYNYTTYLIPGGANYSYYFYCDDGIYTNSTITYNNIEVTETNHDAPILTNQNVNLKGGYTGLTVFNFSVNYTDADNNYPSYVNLIVDSVIYSMDKINPSDISYIDGCSYTYNLIINESGTHSYSFSTSDRGFNVSIGPFIGPYIENRTLMNYTIELNTTYQWIDNTGAIWALPNPDDYIKETLPFQFPFYDDLYSSIYICDDGFVSFHTGYYYRPYSLPTTYHKKIIALFPHSLDMWRSGGCFVKNLTNPNRYVIIYLYARYDNGMPAGSFEIILYESGKIKLQYDIIFDNRMGDAYAGVNRGYGDNYYNQYDGLYDTLDNYAIDFIYGSKNENEPKLNNGQLNPSTGDQSTVYRFTVNYTDIDNNSAKFINAIVNGTIYPMEKKNISDNNYKDGCIYQCSINLNWNPYDYEYFFTCYDGWYTNETAKMSGPTVGYTNIYPPTLTDEAVNPVSGLVNITLFNFTVKYTDQDNNSPLNFVITLDGNNYTMEKIDPTDNNYTDGCIYYYDTTLSTLGTHEFNYTVYDGNFWITSETINNPLVNYIIILSNGGVSPTQGLQGITIFNFTVTYTHPGNQTPSIMDITLDGVNYTMVKADPSDTNYVDGCIYYYNTTLNTLGTHKFNFTANEGSMWVTSSTFNSPLIGLFPLLSNGGVSPTQGLQGITFFNFTVNYTHPGNQAPSIMIITLDGVNYTMEKANPSDTNYLDGCIYYHNTNLNSIGIHSFSFTFSDGTTSIFHGIFSNPTVNVAPILSNGGVSPLRGLKGITVFNFTVTYTHLDNTEPTIMNITLDGVNYTMVKADPSDTNYTDGCIYYYNTTLSTLGTHKFNFTFSDGTITVFHGTFNSPIVNEKKKISKDDVEDNLMIVMIIIMVGITVITSSSIYFVQKKKNSAKPVPVKKLKELEKHQFDKKKYYHKPIRTTRPSIDYLPNMIKKNEIMNIFYRGYSLEEIVQILNDLQITLVSKGLLEKIDSFEWNEKDKIEFIKEILSLSPNERHEILDDMLNELNLKRKK